MAETLGFLSVRHHTEHGYFGGYLVLNMRAKPLEFHCTVPVKPNRAQVLLYGPTIHDFVCGEQIAMALYSKAKLKTPLVITDSASVLALQHVSQVGVALLKNAAEGDQDQSLSIPRSNLKTKCLESTEPSVEVLQDSKLDSDKLNATLKNANFDLAEPFQRIVDALFEAHPVAKAA